METTQKKPWYISSTGKGLSLTLGGVSLAGLVPVIVFIVGLFGFNIGSDQISVFIEAVIQAISAVMIVYGFLRKAYLSIK